MDFGLSEDQELFKTTVRRFLAEQCPTERVREIMETDSAHDPDLWAGLCELGVPAMIVPEEAGGLGSDLLDLALVAEEMGYAATPGPFLGNAMATVALAGSDAEETVRPWLERIAAGEAIATVAIGEAGSQWAPDALQSRVEGNRLSGDKPMVPSADVAEAIVVAARDEDGPGLWLIEREHAGVTVRSLKVNDMTRRLSDIELRDVEAVRLGGSDLLARTIDAGLILVAADAYGGSSRCLEMTRSYALEREQFGQVIGAFQAVKHQLADMAAALEPAMSLYWYAAHAFDHITDQAPRHAAMAKAHLTDLYDWITRMSIELHGGIGFTWEFDLHLWFRRAIFDRGFLGDATYQRARAADMAGW
ncbi:MAG: acyl-CoA dehydrogenase [Deltaproteobacteria bacterium]|nr:MAG: acyl-CoA dehydrogenase [Deltaproteobacteria bacterium]